MSKKRTIFICSSCTYQTSNWIGKCPECNNWNTFEEQSLNNTGSIKKTNENLAIPKLLHEIDIHQHKRLKTEISEFDRVLGGGLVEGSLVLIGGEPGIGKSTLLTGVIGRITDDSKDNKVLYISGEESNAQVAERARRLSISNKNLYILHETNWENIREHIKTLKPKCLVIDSIQTTLSSEINSAPGTVSQIREVTFELMNFTKARGITSFIIGHITKDGNIAGPKILEHMVDAVIYFEGDQNGHYRVLRAIKNRFGNTNEVGIFEMTNEGLKEVSNPSQYFLDKETDGNYGRSLTSIIEGSRTLFIEIQALVVPNKFGNGARITQGIDKSSLSMLIAIIEKYFEINLTFYDIYVNVVGGIKLSSRESDLSVIASIISSYKSLPIDPSTIFIGEVGLTGEIRPTPRMEMRLSEMTQLNYKKIITSRKNAKEYKDKFDINFLGLKNASDLKDFFTDISFESIDPSITV